jgi:hypothetical protein
MHTLRYEASVIGEHYWSKLKYCSMNLLHSLVYRPRKLG